MSKQFLVLFFLVLHCATCFSATFVEKGKRPKKNIQERPLVPPPQGPIGPQGPQGVQGIPGPCGFIAPHTLFVDGHAKIPGNGTLAMPFKTIQEAVSSILAAFDQASLEQNVTIFIAGATYNENVTIAVNPKRIALVALGDVIVGDGKETGLIRWISCGPQLGINSSLCIAGPSHGAFHIRRGFEVIGAPITADLIFNNVQIDQNVTFDNHVSLNLFLYNSIFHGTLQAARGVSENIALQIAENCTFEKSLFVGSYQLVRSCSVEAGMYVRNGPEQRGCHGILNTFFKGTFSAENKTDLLVDGYTNYWFDPYGGNTAKIAPEVTKKVLFSTY